MKQGQRIVAASHAEFVTTAARRIERVMDEQIRRNGSCSIALCGGTTPRPVYQILSCSPRIAWDKVQVYFGDERCVPPDSPQSNYRLARESLLDRVRIPASQVHRMKGESSDLDAAAREYDSLLPQSIDLLLLGIGADGHTASLFPGGAALGETRRRVVTSRSPVAPFDRLTLTPPAITAAGTLFVMVAGAEKGEAVARALKPDTDPLACPGRLALGGNWMLDEASSALLKNGASGSR